MTLAIYAKKCGISEEELRHDAFSLLEPYDDMSVEDINRFTKDDVVCALEMFNEDYVTFPRDDIAKISGLTMPVNKRNWRKQPIHLQGARAIQEINDKANGTNWRKGNGRPIGSGIAQDRCMNGGGSTRRAARPTATGTRALIRNNPQVVGLSAASGAV